MNTTCDVRTHQNEDSTLKHNYCNVMVYFFVHAGVYWRSYGSIRYPDTTAEGILTSVGVALADTGIMFTWVSAQFPNSPPLVMPGTWT